MGGDISTLFIHLLYCLRYGMASLVKWISWKRPVWAVMQRRGCFVYICWFQDIRFNMYIIISWREITWKNPMKWIPGVGIPVCFETNFAAG